MRLANSSGCGQAIVVVEDEVLQAKSIARYLQLKGHRTEYFTDGASALERLKARNVDVLVTDLAVPLVDGRTLAEWGLRHGNLRRVVVISGSSTDFLVDGACDRLVFVPKPFTLEELLRSVEGVPATGVECGEREAVVPAPDGPTG